MRNPYILFVSILIVLLAGCATTKTHFGQLPTESVEFEQQIEQIQYAYPEVKKYDGYLRCGMMGTKCKYKGTVFDMPALTELIELWGEPDEVKISLMNLYFFAKFGLHPYKLYIWNKGSYRIEVEVDHPAVFGWEPHIAYWRWNLIKPKD